MRHAAERHVEVCEHATDRFFELEPDDRRRAKYLPFIELEGRLHGAEMIEFRRWLRWESRWRSVVESMFDAVRKEATDSGILLGKTEGKMEGKAEGKAEAILRILGRRRLLLTEEQRQRVLGCREVELLDRWLDAAIDVGSADEVFAATTTH